MFERYLLCLKQYYFSIHHLLERYLSVAFSSPIRYIGKVPRLKSQQNIVSFVVYKSKQNYYRDLTSRATQRTSRIFRSVLSSVLICDASNFRT
jgi:hypothetical protein